jgi:hypothetical protein
LSAVQKPNAWYAPPHRLTAKDDIGPGRQIITQREVLINDLNPMSGSFARVETLVYLAVNYHPPFIGCMDSSQQLDERALSSTIVANQGGDSACLEGEADAPQRAYSSKRLREAETLYDWLTCW